MAGAHDRALDILESVVGYVMTFIAIWWAWMGFTWFATSYDTDDVPYRIAVFVQMAFLPQLPVVHAALLGLVTVPRR